MDNFQDIHRLKMAKLLKIGFLILAYAAYSLAVEHYNLSRWTSGSCPSRDKCELIGNRGFTERNCECDRFCSTYEDCCIDAIDTPLLLTKSRTCMPYGKLSGVGAYVVGSCPFDYMGPEKLKGLCEDKDDFHDPFFSTPVTDMSTNVTYRNRYCVECNGALPSSLKSWIISVGFKHLPTHYPSEEFIWKYLSFHPLMRKWGIRTARRFYPCYFSFHKPDYISAVRPCRPNLITTCQSDWTNVGVKRACESYTSVVHVLGRSYRNIQCAVCNGEILKQLSCTKSPMHTKIESIPLVFEMMVDFNSKKSTTEGYKKEKCEPGSVLDRFFKKCRGFECAFPIYTFNDGKCKKS
ncbi:UNVERIFIED_CONTAM: hypothetical protein NCL1_53647 [Trichonephila clavipes]